MTRVKDGAPALFSTLTSSGRDNLDPVDCVDLCAVLGFQLHAYRRRSDLSARGRIRRDVLQFQDFLELRHVPFL